MTPPERWLAATSAAGPHGGKGLRGALTALGGVDAVLGADAATLVAHGLSPDAARRLAEADSPAFRIECRLVAQHGVRLVSWEDPTYPVALRDLPSAPLLLYVKGQWPVPAAAPEALQAAAPPAARRALALAVVGTRQPSAYGAKLTRELILALAQQEPGVTIVSGLARGIDGIAHEAALEAKLPTLAVLGNGLSRVYPPEHEALAARVMERGALLSEFPMTAAPLPQNFPVRNRIIAGLSTAVWIVEAGDQSGSLITAGLAQTYGRALLALPGNVDQPESVGTNRILQTRQARLVLDARDLLAALTGRPPEPLSRGPVRPARKGGPKARGAKGAREAKPVPRHPGMGGRGVEGPLPEGPSGRILGALRTGPQHPDDLALAAGLSIEQALGLLLELELSGEIVQTADHGYALP